jgi:N-acyl-D-amino-acid deacylase
LRRSIHRLTGKTLLMHDTTDRGFIAAGKIADITIFDPDTTVPKLREPLATLPAGGARVKRDAIGVDKAIVNGIVLLENSELTGARPAQIIRGPLYRGLQA